MEHDVCKSVNICKGQEEEEGEKRQSVLVVRIVTGKNGLYH